MVRAVRKECVEAVSSVPTAGTCILILDIATSPSHFVVYLHIGLGTEKPVDYLDRAHLLRLET